MDDRIRAKPPKTESHKWTEGTIEKITDSSSGVNVTVSTQSREIQLEITNAVYELFTDRLETENQIEEEPVWFINKSV